MNTLQLEKVLEHYGKNYKFFYGVYAKDKLPLIDKVPAGLIMNNQSSDKEGEHWLAIYFDKRGNCEFFDSFGKSPRFYGIHKYLKSYSHKVIFNRKTIQSNFSEYCGFYCIFFLIFKFKGRSMKYFQKLFKKNPNDNDKMFSKWIDKFF